MEHSCGRVKHTLLLFSVPVSALLRKMKAFSFQSRCLNTSLGTPYTGAFCLYNDKINQKPPKPRTPNQAALKNTVKEEIILLYRRLVAFSCYLCTEKNVLLLC